MSTEELKEEIKKVIEQVPETELEDILDYLKDIISAPIDTVRTSRNLKQIIQEDKKLLEKLAQ